MTLIQNTCKSRLKAMNESSTKNDGGKPSRPVRNRRYTRRSLVAGQRPQKRLFTPEIKRYLKDWLVRRRENPYPNRDEKKHLSRETGLTYIQICNWFANWRRKLKNANADRNQQNWGHLIRTYNDRALGNVEQFSICSDDSIWSEPGSKSPERGSLDKGINYSTDENVKYDHEYSDASSGSTETYNNNNTYPAEVETEHNAETKNITSPMLLSKWLESAARFKPSENNYSWWDGRRGKPRLEDSKMPRITKMAPRHDHDEVEAAVALTALASSATARINAL